jgi:hypothetical protein
VAWWTPRRPAATKDGLVAAVSGVRLVIFQAPHTPTTGGSPSASRPSWLLRRGRPGLRGNAFAPERVLAPKARTANHL